MMKLSILWFILFIHYLTTFLIDLSVSIILCYENIIHYMYIQLNINIYILSRVYVYILYSYC